MAVALAVALPRAGAQSGRRGPIIDMHLHAEHVADYGPTPAVCSDNRGIVWRGWDPREPLDLATLGACSAARWLAPTTDDELLRRTVAMLERHDIRAVTAGTPDDLATWHAAAPDRILPAVNYFRPRADAQGKPMLRDTAELRRLVREGRVAVFAEITPQYWGMSPADPALEPYFALAEEMDVPVGIHLGIGPPAVSYADAPFPAFKSPNYRGSAGDPYLLEDVLVRHPRLRLYAMHAAWPDIPRMLYMMCMHPQLYVDVSVLQYAIARPAYMTALKTLTDAGLTDRIMFGSDGGPRFLAAGIEAIETAPFLTDQQKRDILFNNAIRFFRLDPALKAKPPARTCGG
jgi:predicted TIM-barrel fold metal-dependent hydrolase